jgi:hypothetical protein
MGSLTAQPREEARFAVSEQIRRPYFEKLIKIAIGKVEAQLMLHLHETGFGGSKSGRSKSRNLQYRENPVQRRFSKRQSIRALLCTISGARDILTLSQNPMWILPGAQTYVQDLRHSHTNLEGNPSDKPHLHRLECLGADRDCAKHFSRSLHALYLRFGACAPRWSAPDGRRRSHSNLGWWARSWRLDGSFRAPQRRRDAQTGGLAVSILLPSSLAAQIGALSRTRTGHRACRRLSSIVIEE